MYLQQINMREGVWGREKEETQIQCQRMWETVRKSREKERDDTEQLFTESDKGAYMKWQMKFQILYDLF